MPESPLRAQMVALVANFESYMRSEFGSITPDSYADIVPGETHFLLHERGLEPDPDFDDSPMSFQFRVDCLLTKAYATEQQQLTDPTGVKLDVQYTVATFQRDQSATMMAANSHCAEIDGDITSSNSVNLKQPRVYLVDMTFEVIFKVTLPVNAWGQHMASPC